MLKVCCNLFSVKRQWYLNKYWFFPVLTSIFKEIKDIFGHEIIKKKKENHLNPLIASVATQIN